MTTRTEAITESLQDIAKVLEKEFTRLSGEEEMKFALVVFDPNDGSVPEGTRRTHYIGNVDRIQAAKGLNSIVEKWIHEANPPKLDS